MEFYEALWRLQSHGVMAMYCIENLKLCYMPKDIPGLRNCHAHIVKFIHAKIQLNSYVIEGKFLDIWTLTLPLLLSWNIIWIWLPLPQIFLSVFAVPVSYALFTGSAAEAWNRGAVSLVMCDAVNSNGHKQKNCFSIWAQLSIITQSSERRTLGIQDTLASCWS